MPPKKQPVEEEEDYEGSENTVDELDLEYDDDVDQEYTPRNILSPPRNTQYSVESLYAMIHVGDIDLDPDYQRGFVWTEPKQIALIDSLFRNYYVPPVIFRVIVEGKNQDEKRICIDGKQRLTSIQKFIDGHIPHKDSVTGTKYWSPKATKDGKHHKQGRLHILPERLMSQFHRRQIVCIEYYNLKEEQERDIFNRVQMGMPLSTAERMSAISGQNSELVKRLEKKLSNWPENVPLANDRKRRFQLVGHIVRGIGSLPKFVDPSNQSLEKWLRGPDTQYDEQDIMKDFEIFIQIAQQYAEVAFSSSIATKLAPIEFVYCVILVHQYKNQLQPEQLAQAIQEVRLAIREEHTDVRMNNRCAKSFQVLIRDVLPERIASGAYKLSGKRKRETTSSDLFGDDLTDEDAGQGSRKRKGDISTSSQQSNGDSHLPRSRAAARNAKNGAAESPPPPARAILSPASTEKTMVSNTSRIEGMDIDEIPGKTSSPTPGSLGGSIGGAIGGSLNTSSSNARTSLRETQRSGWGRGLAGFRRYPGPST
ncbi:hypothetical protein CPB86DRAFT_870502 [Serendipita vermifera]|nr:hypothetical protein CPB86DRAFT_870502 [Serendipita vermifera]